MVYTDDKTIEEVHKELVEILRQDGIYNELEYFSQTLRKGDGVFPVFRWLGCFAVEGGNEGHYIHVESINLEGDRDLLYVGKTFEGLDHALKLSNVLTKAFYR